MTLSDNGLKLYISQVYIHSFIEQIKHLLPWETLMNTRDKSSCLHRPSILVEGARYQQNNQVVSTMEKKIKLERETVIEGVYVCVYVHMHRYASSP